MVETVHISGHHARFTYRTGVVIGEGVRIDGKVYRLDHRSDEYAVGFVHDTANLDAVTSCNGRIVPDDVVVWRLDKKSVSVDEVEAKWSEWTHWVAEHHALAPRARATGDPGIQLSSEGVVRKSRRETKNEEEEEREVDEREVEESEEEEDEEDGEGDDEEDEEKDVEVGVE